MISIRRSVGVGGANEPADVAQVQFALKHVAGGPIYKGVIDGRISGALKTAISLFLVRIGLGPDDPDKPLISASGKELQALKAKLPTSITRYALHVNTKGGRLNMVLIDPVSGKSGLPKASTIAVPSSDATLLVRSLRRVFDYYGFVFRVHDEDVNGRGEFTVRLTLENGLAVNRQTGAPEALTDQSYRHFISNGDFEGWNLVPGRNWWLVLATSSHNYVFASAPAITLTDRKNNLSFYSVMGFALGNAYKNRIFRSAVHPLGREVKRPKYNEKQPVFLKGAEAQAILDAVHILKILDPQAARALEDMVESSRQIFKTFGTMQGYKRLYVESFNVDLFFIGGIGISGGQLIDIESHHRYLFLSVEAGLGVDLGVSGRAGVVFVPLDKFSGFGWAASGSFGFIEGNLTFTPNREITSASGGWSISLNDLLPSITGSVTGGYTWVIDVDRFADEFAAMLQGNAINYMTGRLP